MIILDKPLFEFDDDEIETRIYDIYDLAIDLMERDNLEGLILTPNSGYVGVYSPENEEEEIDCQ